MSKKKVVRIKESTLLKAMSNIVSENYEKELAKQKQIWIKENEEKNKKMLEEKFEEFKKSLLK